MKINDLEKTAEIQRKYGSYNTMLAFVMVVASLSIGTIIWQNNRALDKIANELAESRNNSNLIALKLQEIEKKLDIIFMEKFQISYK